jgi:hypothetical protein
MKKAAVHLRHAKTKHGGIRPEDRGRVQTIGKNTCGHGA